MFHNTRRMILLMSIGSILLLAGFAVADRSRETSPVVAPVPADRAMIRVKVLEPKAIVWFDGNLTSQVGTDRLFFTPPIQPNELYTYRIKAQWVDFGRIMVEERSVQVLAGKTTVVDFTRRASEQTPPF